MPTDGSHAATLLGVSALAGTAFGVVATASARRATIAPDHRLHAEMVERMDGPTRDAAEAIAPAVDHAGKWWIYAPTALATAAAVAAAIAVVPAVATALSPAFDRWLPQPPTGPRRRPVDHPVFPSGHAFRAAAVALVAGYVVVREDLAGPGRTWPLAVAAPVAVGLGRLVREKHLASDVLGGWLAGVALAALAAGR